MDPQAADGFPSFTYNSVAKEECFETSEESCSCCKQKRGYIYNGPIYGAFEDDEPVICAWCITDGSACDKLDVELISGDYIVGDDSDVAFNKEFKRCTPSFVAWQQDKWFTHCGDAAEYFGAGGIIEIESLGGGQALDYFRNIAKVEYCYETEAEQDEFLHACGKDSDTTAYIFKCKNCGSCGGFIDSN